MKKRSVLVAFVSIFLLTITNLVYFNSLRRVEAASDIVYVTTDGDCRGATPCFDELQTAVNAVAPGGTVKVANGHYTGVSTSPVHSTGDLQQHNCCSLIKVYQSLVVM